MKYLVSGIMLAALIAGPAAGQAEPAKRLHKTERVHHVRVTPEVVAPGRNDAASYGNNANSMTGSNSANENAEGRTGGGFN